MSNVVAFALGAAVVVIAAYVYERYGKRALHNLLADLNAFITKLEAFKAEKELEIADHLEQIALNQSHVSLKGAERDRATRIRDRINELLA